MDHDGLGPMVMREGSPPLRTASQGGMGARPLTSTRPLTRQNTAGRPGTTTSTRQGLALGLDGLEPGEIAALSLSLSQHTYIYWRAPPTP